MKRILPFVFAVAFSAPAFAQTVDSQGAKKLTDDLAHYFGRQGFDIGLLKITADGDAYKLAFDFKPLVALLAKEQSLKFDVSPYSMRAKPRQDGQWDVSADTSLTGSLDFTGPKGPQHVDFSVSNNKFTGVYDPALAAFVSATGSMDAMSMKTREPTQEAHVSAGAGTATITSTKSANGGIDFTMAEKILDFAEIVQINDPDRGLNFPVTLNAPELSVTANGKGVRTKPLLDLLAFAVANEDEAKLKANQAEFKSHLLAVLPVWERIDGTYAFKNFAMESPVGKWGAKQLDLASGMDGVSQNGKINYAIKASGLTIPRQLLPAWTAPLVPTDIDLNFGGANIDLDTMAKKAIEAFDLNQNPPLSDEFGQALVADFKAKKPKVVLGHSTVKNGDIEVAMEGEMTFPGGEKPDASVTVDVAGYDKIVDALKEAAKSDEQMAQAFPFALAVKGFGKTMPDGRLEWVIDTKADGSVKVNGAMLKGPDAVQEAGGDQDGGGANLNDNSSGDDNATGGDGSDGGDSGGAGAKLQP
ncbi:DUF2125 domain-containing protein [Mesorhizobium sp. CU2]|uniref:DUF2125 domain-containing protein n=1 Tax=unclassified Mesorhizobium TaxID=325217 RepID=UPI00112D2DA5|nr:MULTISPECIES: DUF2125 domain-containing protein [unclassified Mesorhizobium]TPN88418.1 DUF2125 domain-containing protein [Mesorhizobium sp. CU3]TPO15607.1 DUF2125 domain-containing protein [Mesorhizobium sp. CU2]